MRLPIGLGREEQRTARGKVLKGTHETDLIGQIDEASERRNVAPFVTRRQLALLRNEGMRERSAHAQKGRLGRSIGRLGVEAETRDVARREPTPELGVELIRLVVGHDREEPVAVQAIEALIPLEAHLHVPRPAERNVVADRIQHQNGLVVGLVDHRERATEPHDESIEGLEEGVVFVPKGLHALGCQIPPRPRIDVVRVFLVPLHDPRMARETPVHDLDIRARGLKVRNDRDVEIHTKQPHLGIPLL